MIKNISYKKLLAVFIIFILLMSFWVLPFLLELRVGKLKALVTPLPANQYEFADSGNKNTTKVILFGDSRIEGWQFSWPKNINVINAGIASSTVFQSLKRLENDVLRLEPDWVVVQVGVNDVVASRMVLGRARSDIINRAADGLIILANKLAESNINIIFMTVLPSINPDITRQLFWQGDLDTAVRQINNHLEERLSDDVVVLDSYKFFQNSGGVWKAEFSRDALHWSREAYRQLSVCVVKIISES